MTGRLRPALLLIPALGLCLLTLGARPAWADRYDVQLAGFGTPTGAGPNASVQLDASGFKALATDMALALEPRFGGPAGSTGGLGVDVGYDIAITSISQDSRHWREAVADPGGALPVSQITVRKGLPYSFELGLSASHIHQSGIWGIGIEGKWAFVEGYRYAPDLAFRVHVETMLGSRDMSMLSTGLDAMISKAFGLGGLVSLTPYLGYAFTYIRASTHVIGRFQQGNIQPNLFVLPSQNIFSHRALIGLKLNASIADMGFEMALGKVQTYAIHAGLSF